MMMQNCPLKESTQLELDRWLKEELDKGFIRQSKSLTTAPILLLERKSTHTHTQTHTQTHTIEIHFFKKTRPLRELKGRGG